MPLFPTLKTGAIAQYPATVKLGFGPTQTVEFLDGSSQRYCTGPAPLRQWLVRFDLLDARESATLAEFLQRHYMSAFAFVDPFTGTTVPRCGLQGREFVSAIHGELNNTMSVVIEELP